MLQVIRQILTFIRARAYEPGERLPSERDFSQRFGVSRGVVREAIQSLTTVRVVDARRTSGLFLRKMDAEASFEALILFNAAGIPPHNKDIAQSIEVRLLLEREAIRLACARRTDKDIEELEVILGEAVNVSLSGKSIEEEDQRLHLAIAGATGNQILVRIMNAFCELSKSRRRVLFTDPTRRHICLETHRALISAIKSRDVAAGQELVAIQMQRGIDYFAPGES